MNPDTPHSRIRRSAQLVLGSVLVGAGIAAGLAAGLGVDPIGMLVAAVATRTGQNYTLTNTLLALLVVLALWTNGRRPGIGTLLQPVLVGASIDVLLAHLPTPEHWAAQGGMLLLGILTLSLGAATYLGARLGEGPFDAAALHLSEKLHQPLGRTYILYLTGIAAAGMLLGGPWGIGTLAAAALTGPAIALLRPHLDTKPDTETQRTQTEPS